MTTCAQCWRRRVVRRPAALRERVEGVWLALGGPACAADRTGLDNASAFFDLLEKMDRGGSLDIAAFEERIHKLYAYPDSLAGDSLQVMTIYNAKGLEFDTVIVPRLGRTTRADEARLMLWLERPRARQRARTAAGPDPCDWLRPGPNLRLLQAHRSAQIRIRGRSPIVRGRHQRQIGTALARACHLPGEERDRWPASSPSQLPCCGACGHSLSPNFSESWQRYLLVRPANRRPRCEFRKPSSGLLPDGACRPLRLARPHHRNQRKNATPWS